MPPSLKIALVASSLSALALACVSRIEGSLETSPSAGVTSKTPSTVDAGASRVDAKDAGAQDPGDPTGDPYHSVFDAVSEANLGRYLRELTGADTVTAGGRTFKMTNRWSAEAKADFRAYFRHYFETLGATVTEVPFKVSQDDLDAQNPGETQGHDIEAVLPGASKDSLVVIVHYDTLGIKGQETLNPGADDDGSGLAMLMEAARIFAAIPNRHNTVRFVAADYEEISENLGGYAYVSYLKAQATAQGFKIIAASDDDQTGWSCWDEDPSLCTKVKGRTFAKNTTFKLITCSGADKKYDYPDLRDGLLSVAAAYQTTMQPFAMCDGDGDTDHFPFWVAGIPAYVIEEWGSENNPHYDKTGHDTLETIDMSYLTQISRIQIAFQAKLMGIEPRAR
jgi:hypothetical protein